MVKYHINKNNAKNEQQADENVGIRYYDSTTQTIKNALAGENEDTLNKQKRALINFNVPFLI